MAAEPDLARRMASWRAYRGVTLDTVGNAAGVTRQAIHNVEQGTADLKVGALYRICRRAFATDLKTFFGPLPKVTP